MRRSDLMAVSPMWLVHGYPSAAVPNQTLRTGENFLQLLTIETVFVHHFVDELLGIRVISEIAAHLHLCAAAQAGSRQTAFRWSFQSQ